MKSYHRDRIYVPKKQVGREGEGVKCVVNWNAQDIAKQKEYTTTHKTVNTSDKWKTATH